MKKLLLSLGALSAVVAPVAAVAACGSTAETHENADKTIAAQRVTITASNAPKKLKDAALTELAKVKDAKGLVAFYKTEAFKAYITAVTTAVNAAPVVKEVAHLELGNLLSTDLAKNISKTDTVLEDQTSEEKTTARGLLDYYHFDEKREEAFRTEISKAKSASAVDSIIRKIESVGDVWKNAQDALVAPKSTAYKLIDGFTLSVKDKTNYENKIKGAQNQEEIDAILDEARTTSSGNDVSDEVKRQQGFAISTIKQDDLLPRDKAAAIEEIKKAKTETDAKVVPVKYAHRTYKETVHIGVALSGDFAVQADEIKNGQFVYFPKTAKVGDKVTWTDTSTPASTKTVVYEVSSIDNGGVPVISVTINGTKSTTPGVVDTLKGVAMVLTDYTGTYLIKGVADKKVFEDNEQIKDFLNTYLDKMKSGDIINKWTELKATFKYISPSENLNTISYDNTNHKFMLSHNN